MIHSSVNVEGQAKYLEIFIILWDKHFSCFFLQMKKYSAAPPGPHARHTSNTVNITQVE